MFRVVFYYDRSNRSPVKNYLDVLRLKNDKDSRINIVKITDYINVLSAYGVRRGAPIVKHLRGKIWELRPINNRILFFNDNDTYVLLHVFEKETQKTPKEEIIKAEKEMKDYLERKNDE